MNYTNALCLTFLVLGCHTPSSEWEPIVEVDGWVTLVAGQLVGSTAPDLLIAETGCTAAIRPGPGFGVGPSLDADGHADDTCKWLLGWFGGAAQQPVTIARAPGIITYWSGDPLEPATLDLNGALDGAVLLESEVPGDPRLLVTRSSEGSVTMLVYWNWPSFPEPCVAELAVPYGLLEAGDLDGDGVDELAVVTQWPHPAEVRLFSINY